MIEAYTLILSDQTALSTAARKPLTWGWGGGVLGGKKYSI